jgi:hypothetical protein
MTGQGGGKWDATGHRLEIRGESGVAADLRRRCRIFVNGRAGGAWALHRLERQELNDAESQPP